MQVKRLRIDDAELLAQKFRADIGLSATEPVSVKSILRRLNIQTIYRPMSENSYGVSVKTPNNIMFVLVNSNSTRGRQHFTIAHELYHLYFDEAPTPHICGEAGKNPTERNADMFASAFLMPRVGVLKNIPKEELGNVSISTVLKLEQLFQVSRSTLLIRLESLNVITKKQYEELSKYSVKESAKNYGYTDLSLYEKGNEGISITDFGEKARKLFDQGMISEGHYMELLNMLQYGGN